MLTSCSEENNISKNTDNEPIVDTTEYTTLDNGDVVDQNGNLITSEFDDDNSQFNSDEDIDSIPTNDVYAPDSGAYGDIDTNNYPSDYQPQFRVMVKQEIDMAFVRSERMVQKQLGDSYVQSPARFNTYLNLISMNPDPIRVNKILVNRGSSCPLALKNAGGTVKYGQSFKLKVYCTPDEILEVMIQTEQGNVVYTF